MAGCCMMVSSALCTCEGDVYGTSVCRYCLYDVLDWKRSLNHYVLCIVTLVFFHWKL